MIANVRVSRSGRSHRRCTAKNPMAAASGQAGIRRATANGRRAASKQTASAMPIQRNCIRPTSSATGSEREVTWNFAGAAIRFPETAAPAQSNVAAAAAWLATAPALERTCEAEPGCARISAPPPAGPARPANRLLLQSAHLASRPRANIRIP